MEEYLAAEDRERRPILPPAPPAPPVKAKPAARAGWYPHPTMAETQRYWDGFRWTDHIAPGLPASRGGGTAASPASDHTGLIVAGIVTAVVIPFIGFIIGCVLLSKKPGPGVGVMVISVIAFGFWYGALSSHTSTGGGY